MKLAIDAMSGDLGSSVVVEACQTFHKNHPDVELYITGKQEELSALENIDGITIVDAPEVVLMTDTVIKVRRKKNSSMVKALLLGKEGIVDGVVSCGSTGAFYTAAMLFCDRIEGVDRSCLMTILPTQKGNPTCLLDVGANASNTAEQLESFATMGDIYAKKVLGIPTPKIALLNIGTEHHKGDDVHKDAYKLLSAHEDMNFIGNIEGRDILTGDNDVIVTDGFSGNIALKSIEGAVTVLMKEIKASMMGSLKSKIGALLSKKSLYSLKDKFDYKSVGGALMMGFTTAIVKAHGSSDAKAINSAMELTLKMIENHVVETMKEGIMNENS